MTTMVTVNAHAGWEVEVLCRYIDNDGKTVSVSAHVVPANTEQVFYIHNNMELIKVQELKK